MASRAIYGVCARQVGWGPALKVERSHACKTRTWPASTVWIPCASLCMAETTMNCSSPRSEEHTSELQSLTNLVCRLLLEKKNSICEKRPSGPYVPSPDNPLAVDAGCGAAG